MKHRNVVANGAKSADGALDLGNIHEQIGNEHDHSPSADEPRGLLERGRRGRSTSRSLFLERSNDASPLTVARSRRHRASNRRVEAYEAHRIALAEEKEGERRGQAFAVR